jgi:arylformamidase
MADQKGIADLKGTRNPTRRGMLAAAGVGLSSLATPSIAQQFGPPPHTKGPRVFLDYDQVELDAAYTQAVYEPNLPQIQARFTSNSEATLARIGQPRRVAYGPTEIEKLDIYRSKRAKAPIFIFLHGGAWRGGSARDFGFVAEMLLDAGAHYVVPDFVWVQDAGGNLMVMADQVRRAVAWVYKNAASFGGDPARLYIGGQSSGAHLAAVALTTDWKKEFGLPGDLFKGGLCISGMYDLKPVRLSARSSYVKFDDATEDALSPRRHLDQLRAPIIVSYGTLETPEFQRQARDFAAAVKSAGKPVELMVGENYAHLEMAESIGNPYSVMGRAVLRQIGLNVPDRREPRH